MSENRSLCGEWPPLEVDNTSTGDYNITDVSVLIRLLDLHVDVALCSSFRCGCMPMIFICCLAHDIRVLPVAVQGIVPMSPGPS